MFEELALFVTVGFVAQLIDGAVGMAYGLFATSVLLGLGVPPATAIILGLVLGGVLAAPVAALAVQRLPGRLPMAVVGVAVSLLALRNLLATLKPGSG